MNRKAQRAELLQQYKEIKIEAGVYQIKNTLNGKVYVDGTPDLRSLNGKTVTLNTGSHTNKLLQKEWAEFGQHAFVIEVLEILKPNDNQYVVLRDELKKLKEIWIEKLQPFGERGYHKLNH
jgi:hypothetical protein